MKRRAVCALLILTLGISTLNTQVKANDIEITAGATSFLIDTITNKAEVIVVENETAISEQAYGSQIPTCWKKYTCERFKYLGRVWYGNYTYTWYSQRLLPGGGLNIPGRHLNEYGLVVDENEYVVVAGDDLEKGTIIDTPIGIQGIVYDAGSGGGNLDIYCDW